MAKDSSDGVVDSLGKVFKVENANVTTTNTYDKLYVIDGAIIVPSSLGVNPSLTITALALRIAEEQIRLMVTRTIYHYNSCKSYFILCGMKVI